MTECVFLLTSQCLHGNMELPSQNQNKHIKSCSCIHLWRKPKVVFCLYDTFTYCTLWGSGWIWMDIAIRSSLCSVFWCMSCSFWGYIVYTWCIHLSFDFVSSHGLSILPYKRIKWTHKCIKATQAEFQQGWNNSMSGVKLHSVPQIRNNMPTVRERLTFAQTVAKPNCICLLLST